MPRWLGRPESSTDDETGGACEKKPTLHDVAAKAGVSYATAVRVLNRRARVSTKSVEKVRAAVAELGYVRNV
ncbi:LacI family DNA-binding transcriptional regulator [Sulfitobacter sp.]|uniref:LacI family DNA-binding transcriptional regulator n=1 Tax=Sulfitobacter sp. TaxID=1903071 RepID=UPI003FCC757D